jgi:hypothetical protein
MDESPKVETSNQEIRKTGFGTLAMGVVALVSLGLGVGADRIAIKGAHKAVSPADSPVVVRGGSLNLFANAGASRWNPSGNLFAINNVPLNNIYLDGVIPPSSAATDPVAQSAPIQPTHYWSITLTLRDNGVQHITICTKLDQSGTSCNTNSTDSLPASTSGTIYVQGDSSNTLNTWGLKIKHFDRSGANARLHYAVSDCSLNGTDASGNPIPDADDKCDKIKKFVVQDGASSSEFKCVDGACDIGIGAPAQ